MSKTTQQRFQAGIYIAGDVRLNDHIDFFTNRADAIACVQRVIEREKQRDCRVTGWVFDIMARRGCPRLFAISSEGDVSIETVRPR